MLSTHAVARLLLAGPDSEDHGPVPNTLCAVGRLSGVLWTLNPVGSLVAYDALAVRLMAEGDTRVKVSAILTEEGYPTTDRITIARFCKLKV